MLCIHMDILLPAGGDHARGVRSGCLDIDRYLGEEGDQRIFTVDVVVVKDVVVNPNAEGIIDDGVHVSFCGLIVRSRCYE